MTNGMRWNWILAGLAAILVLLFLYAWIDGGREPIREIAQPIPVPELPQ